MVQLVLCAQTSPFSEMRRICKWYTHMSKIPTFTYNRANNVIPKNAFILNIMHNIFKFLDMEAVITMRITSVLSFVLNIYFGAMLYHVFTISCVSWIIYKKGGRCGRDPMVVGFTTTFAISVYHHWYYEFESRSGRRVQHYVIKFVNDLRQIGGFLLVLRFPPPIKLIATI